MTRHYPPPPTRRKTRSEDEETYTAELCIRVFERVMDWIGEDEELGRSRYFDIFAAYTEVLQDELKDYAFDLAYHLYSEDPIVKQRRRELSRRRRD